jgi:hypothetical protein
MTKKQPTEKPKAVPKSPKVSQSSHSFPFLKSLNFSHFFYRKFFRCKISNNPSGLAKVNKPGIGKSVLIAIISTITTRMPKMDVVSPELCSPKFCL